MQQIIRFFLWLLQTFLNGFYFAAANRDIRRNVPASCVEYWTLAVRLKARKWFGWKHKPEKPFSILGMKLYAYSVEALSLLVQEIFLNRQYAIELSSDTPLIVDCGSNIGVSILFFKKLYPRARVIGFEPDPQSFQMLSRNIRENGLQDITIHNMAVAARSGEITFYSLPNKPGSLLASTVPGRINGEAFQVPCVTLSSMMPGPVDLLKLDIEGAEVEVIRELAASDALGRIKTLLLEYHHHVSQDEDLAGMLRILEDYDFTFDVAAALPPRPGQFQDILLKSYKRGTAPGARPRLRLAVGEAR